MSVPKGKYRLTFMPNHHEPVSQSEAKAFGEKLQAEFGYEMKVGRHLLESKQFIVTMDVVFKDLRRIVTFMRSKGFGDEVAKAWLLNAVGTSYRDVVGVSSPDYPISSWIGPYAEREVLYEGDRKSISETKAP